jgi:L-lactate dehydrogenase complex protein LldG
MSKGTTARAEVLARVSQAIGNFSDTREAEYSAIPRAYNRRGESEPEAVLALLTARLKDYGAGTWRCSAADISQTVAAVLKARGKTSLLHPQNLPAEWLPASSEFREVDGLSYEEIDRAEGVITGCAAAIALTGTIIIAHTIAGGRRALTLIPDYHLCIVFAGQVAETVHEGIARLKGMENLPITTISGPSATADIEMTRVKGVHGPRFLDVVLVS